MKSKPKQTVWEKAKAFAARELDEGRLYDLNEEFESLKRSLRDEVAFAYDAGYNAGVRAKAAAARKKRAK